MKLHQPILNGPEFFQRIFTRFVIQIIEEYESHSSRNRSHFRLTKSFGNLFTGFLNTLIYKLSGKINIRSILKVNINNGQPKIRNRTYFFQIRQTIHGNLYWIGYIFFNLLRCQALCCGKYLNQIGRYIRECINRQLFITAVPCS